MLNSCHELIFEVIKKADKSRYANGIDRRLDHLGPIALFSNFKLTTTSGKLLEDISHARIVSFMYKLLTSNRSTDDLSIGFDRYRNRRPRELTENKNMKGKFHVRNMLKEAFGLAELQEKATFGLGYNLTITRNKD